MQMRRTGASENSSLLHRREPIAGYLVPFRIRAQGAEADEAVAPVFHRNPKERARLFGLDSFRNLRTAVPRTKAIKRPLTHD
jgi:hypothetical protein